MFSECKRWWFPRLDCVRTVPQPGSFLRLGSALSEKQAPQVIEEIENSKQQIEGLKSCLVLRRHAFQSLLEPE